MWRDDDKLIDIYRELKDIKTFPVRCPICEKKRIHLYMDVHNLKTRRGGLWIWCSKCYSFLHSTIYVPQYWKNCPDVDAMKLCAIPDYLNDIREVVDMHINTLINTGIT